MNLINKYLDLSSSLKEEFSHKRQDNIVLFSQAGTTLSGNYYKVDVVGFPKNRYQPIIRFDLNGDLDQTLKNLNSSKILSWKELKKLQDWSYERVLGELGRWD